MGMAIEAGENGPTCQEWLTPAHLLVSQRGEGGADRMNHEEHAPLGTP